MNIKNIGQLWLRLAVSSAFLSAVADRLGLWGKPGSPHATWGNWEQFLTYSNMVNSFAPAFLLEFLAVTATVLEVMLALLLLIGYKTKWSAYMSAILLTLFAVAMTISFGIKSTFTYSVWIGAASCLLLGSVKSYAYSMDDYLSKMKNKVHK
ncbi:hypothetical protein GCM10007415_33650 [Parapedobacter pyrenivorans]|uniref:DoxX protein n=1 Tax=Parapedobacter pyrenivorans TaxID=1305674 RepID=A0A917HY30_9SPHI|nr:DoxX family membrane protein [Parapedobacter pyrenivorans]GGG95700.1 hypothetical protein GCM10007415_33650 [Parapedobacter pyrenivorans]